MQANEIEGGGQKRTIKHVNVSQMTYWNKEEILTA